LLDAPWVNGEDSQWFVTCGSGISDLEMIEITAPKLAGRSSGVASRRRSGRI
jgi:hypothetical protein